VQALRMRLTQRELAKARDAVYGGGAADAPVVRSTGPGAYVFRRSDFRLLRDGAWLNDEIINGVVDLVRPWVAADAARGAGPRVYMPSSFFFKSLMGNDAQVYTYANVRGWTKRAKVDVFACDLVVVPRNVGNTHWTCLCLDMRRRVAYSLDSLGGAREGAAALQSLLRWLRDEAADKKGDAAYSTDGWRIEPAPADTPRQANGVDCGVFAAIFAFFLAQGHVPTSADFKQADIPALRLAIAAMLLRQSVDGSGDEGAGAGSGAGAGAGVGAGAGAGAAAASAAVAVAAVAAAEAGGDDDDVILID
jgi:sentrin-specific protease 1